MSCRATGDALDPATPVDPSPPKRSGAPSAKTRQPPAKAHSAGGGVGDGLGDWPALAETDGRCAMAGVGAGKNRSQGLTRAAPRKMPTRNVAIGTARLTAFERTGSTRNSP